MPFFSVVLPVYNVAAYLERCVQSVLNQNFFDYELILVDDGSTDSSGEICDRLAAEHACIRVIHKENGGLSSARNAGLEAAEGRYVWWVDSDDWIEKDALLLLYEAAANGEPDVVKFPYYRIEDGKKILGGVVQPGEYMGDVDVWLLREQAFLQSGIYSLSSCMHIYRADFIKKNRLLFVSERMVGSEDYLFNLQVLLVAENIIVLSKPLYYYEMRLGSLTQRYKKNLPERYTELYRHLKAYYAERGLLEAYERYIDRFFVWHLMRGTCMPNEYGETKDHTVRDGRKKVKAFMKTDVFAKAVKNCETRGLSRKKQLQLWAMSFRMEWLFYWMYGLKPRLRRRNIR